MFFWLCVLHISQSPIFSFPTNLNCYLCPWGKMLKSFKLGNLENVFLNCQNRFKFSKIHLFSLSSRLEHIGPDPPSSSFCQFNYWFTLSKNGFATSMKDITEWIISLEAHPCIHPSSCHSRKWDWKL